MDDSLNSYFGRKECKQMLIIGFGNLLHEKVSVKKFGRTLKSLYLCATLRYNQDTIP